MRSHKQWFFMVMAFVLCAGLVTSFILPWWTGVISAERQATLNIYGWGIPDQQSYIRAFMLSDITPQYKTILAWVFVGFCILIASSGIFVRKRLHGLMLTSVGMFVLAYAFIAYFVVIMPRLGDYGISLYGVTKIGEGYTAYTVNASIGFGWILTCVTGGLLFILGIFQFIMER